MIDRRMGMYGHPLDIEVLFDAALRSSREILGIDASQDDKKYIKRIDDRIGHSILENPDKIKLLIFDN
jgi:hypothetical protein